jgi:hypothetical protein
MPANYLTNKIKQELEKQNKNVLFSYDIQKGK